MVIGYVYHQNFSLPIPRPPKASTANANVACQIAMGPSKLKALNKENASNALIDKVEKIKASVRAKVERPFRFIKRQFGYIKDLDIEDLRRTRLN